MGLGHSAGRDQTGDEQANAFSSCSSCSALHFRDTWRVCLRPKQCDEPSMLEEQLEYQH
jgi:hypothetical protein